MLALEAEGGREGAGGVFVEKGDVRSDDTGISGSNRRPDTHIRAKASRVYKAKRTKSA